MQPLRSLDSHSPAVRAIERWKRGLTALAILAIMCMAATLPAVAAFALVQVIGGSVMAQELTGMAVFVIYAPWFIGSRVFLREVGKLAYVSDN